MQTYKPWSDCSEESNLIWVHIVCNIGYQVHKQVGEQMTTGMNGGKKVNKVKNTNIFSHRFQQLGYSKTCLKRPLKNRQNKVIIDKL